MRSLEQLNQQAIVTTKRVVHLMRRRFLAGAIDRKDTLGESDLDLHIHFFTAHIM